MASRQAAACHPHGQRFPSLVPQNGGPTVPCVCSAASGASLSRAIAESSDGGGRRPPRPLPPGRLFSQELGQKEKKKKTKNPTVFISRGNSRARFSEDFLLRLDWSSPLLILFPTAAPMGCFIRKHSRSLPKHNPCSSENCRATALLALTVAFFPSLTPDLKNHSRGGAGRHEIEEQTQAYQLQSAGSH